VQDPQVIKLARVVAVLPISMALYPARTRSSVPPGSAVGRTADQLRPIA
jgi:hypothetical protein